MQPIQGFVYESVRFSEAVPETIEAVVFPRRGSKARCSGCERHGSTDDHLHTRVWVRSPLGRFSLVLVYTLRRVQCPAGGVGVEKVPWATGKPQWCDGLRLFLAAGARKLSWQEVAQRFRVSWADVDASVQGVVEYGLQHRVVDNIQAIGMDEICVRVGRVFWSLIYPIDAHRVRWRWIGPDRKAQTRLAGFNAWGDSVCAGRRDVCSDRWAPDRAAVRQRLPKALHVLDRFQIRQPLHPAVDEIRNSEARARAQAGLQPRLKPLRRAWLKQRQHWTPKERRRLHPLEHAGLASLRADWRGAVLEHFWGYLSPTWAGKFLDSWGQCVGRSRLQPLKRVAATLTQHREILLNDVRAKKRFRVASSRG